jgi:hypothetical protein
VLGVVAVRRVGQARAWLRSGWWCLPLKGGIEWMKGCFSLYNFCLFVGGLVVRVPGMSLGRALGFSRQGNTA